MVKDDVKAWLDSLKEYKRESYNDTMEQLMDLYKKHYGNKNIFIATAPTGEAHIPKEEEKVPETAIESLSEEERL